MTKATVPDDTRRRDILTLIDDVKALQGFDMTRASFFRIEAGSAVVDFVATLRGLGVPFAIFGSTFVIDRPATDTHQFENGAQIDRLFDQIEGVEGLVVETSHLWLPNELFSQAASDLAGDAAVGILKERGAVWRLSRDLFRLTLRFQRESIGSERYLHVCRQIRSGDPYALYPSPTETDVFRAWSEQQIEESRANYEDKLKKPGLALRWRDERGEIHAG